jgi:hypothetical protein
MKKIYLSAIGFAFICNLKVSAQVRQDSVAKSNISLYAPVTSDTSSYNPRKLKVDEIDFVSSFYWQNGFHSAVTGGIGTEHVTDLSNGLDLHLLWLGNHNNINHLDVGMGFDYHTAASQAYVSKTGASSPTGTRIYPSLDYTLESAKTGNTIGVGAYYSGEYNYQSLGTDLHFSVKTDNKNGEFSAKLQGYFDQVKLIYPSELIPASTTTTTSTGTVITTASGSVISSDGETSYGSKKNIPSSPRTTLSAAFSYSQQINERLQIMFLGDVVGQHGYLGLPFHRVYFNNGKDTVEKLPSSRFKLPVGFRLNYFLGDNIIIRTYYRYYQDNWGIKSNTIGLEVPYKITPFFSISPFYRFYEQSASTYFAPYEQHLPTDEYYTSNYEYAKFNSQFFGVGFRIAPPKGVFGWQGLHDMEIRYGHYTQTTGLQSDVVSLGLSFK